MPRLLVEKGPDRGKSVTIQAGQQVIAGRDKGAELQLSDQMASRRHFLIASRNGVFGLKDLNSANGTLLNGRQAEGARRLKYGDSIQVGETLMSWLSDDQTETHGGLIGHQIAGYRIEERLGRGAMGTVYKATQLSLGRTVALKVLAPELVKDERFCEMFVKEARAAGGLNHPNIIQVYDVGDQDDTYYFSMEFASRGSVQEELGRRKSIKLPRAVRIIKDACAALDYAERKGLVHRDIKPDNLMVTEDETVKLGDLGLAMSAQELQAEQDGVFGTPHYIAPEQAMGKSIDHRADIYALGATFYRMLSGRTLFQGATVKEILKKQVREPHAPVTEHVHDCPRAITAIIDRMLAKDPADRYQHAADIIADLQDWEIMAGRKGVVDSAVIGRAPSRLSPEDSQLLADYARRRKLALVGMVALICLLTAAGSIWFFLYSGAVGTPPAGNRGAPPKGAADPQPDEPTADPEAELSPETMASNERLKDELTYVEFLIEDDTNPGAEQYRKAVERLDNALEEHPAASDEWKQRVKDRLGELAAAEKELAQAAGEVEKEWQEVRRDALGQIRDFKTLAAGETVQEFIDRHSSSTHKGVQEILEKAGEWLKTDYPQHCSDGIKNFEDQVVKDLDAASELPLPDRLSRVKEIYGRVRDAAAASDDSTYRPRLQRRAKALEDRLAGLRRDARAAEEREADEALRRAGQSLEKVLEKCRSDIARGNFVNVATRLDEWQSGNEDFLEYGQRELFKPIRRAIEHRREETVLQHKALAALKLPSMSTQNEILAEQPWPEHVSDFLGAAKRYVVFRCKSELSDSQWTTVIYSAERKERTVTGDVLKDSGDRRGMAGAIAHLVQHDTRVRDAMMERIGDVPAMVGLFAWMSDMDAGDIAFPLIEQAFLNTPVSDSSYAEVREYYALGLLDKARAHAALGESSEEERLLKKLKEEFSETRANQGLE